MTTPEICAYKPMEYSERCKDCTGKNQHKMCYTTIHSLREHIDEFYQIFDLDDGRLEVALRE